MVFRAMFDLAMNESQGPILNEIADRISRNGVSRTVICYSKEEGLVNSVRGPMDFYWGFPEIYRTDTQTERRYCRLIVKKEDVAACWMQMLVSPNYLGKDKR